MPLPPWSLGPFDSCGPGDSSAFAAPEAPSSEAAFSPSAPFLAESAGDSVAEVSERACAESFPPPDVLSPGPPAAGVPFSSLAACSAVLPPVSFERSLASCVVASAAAGPALGSSPCLGSLEATPGAGFGSDFSSGSSSLSVRRPCSAASSSAPGTGGESSVPGSSFSAAASRSASSWSSCSRSAWTLSALVGGGARRVGVGGAEFAADSSIWSEVGTFDTSRSCSGRKSSGLSLMSQALSSPPPTSTSESPPWPADSSRSSSSSWSWARTPSSVLARPGKPSSLPVSLGMPSSRPGSSLLAASASAALSRALAAASSSASARGPSAPSWPASFLAFSSACFASARSPSFPPPCFPLSCCCPCCPFFSVPDFSPCFPPCFAADCAPAFSPAAASCCPGFCSDCAAGEVGCSPFPLGLDASPPVRGSDSFSSSAFPASAPGVPPCGMVPPAFSGVLPAARAVSPAPSTACFSGPGAGPVRSERSCSSWAASCSFSRSARMSSAVSSSTSGARRPRCRAVASLSARPSSSISVTRSTTKSCSDESSRCSRRSSTRSWSSSESGAREARTRCALSVGSVRSDRTTVLARRSTSVAGSRCSSRLRSAWTVV